MNEWISLKDQLPVIREAVLVCTCYGVGTAFLSESGKWVVEVCEERFYQGRGWSEKEATITDVTHWMPLPKLPEEV